MPTACVTWNWSECQRSPTCLGRFSSRVRNDQSLARVGGYGPRPDLHLLLTRRVHLGGTMKKLSRSQFLTLVAGVLLFVPSVARGQQPAEQNEKVATLELGKVIEREIASGETHRHQVILETGQFR